MFTYFGEKNYIICLQETAISKDLSDVYIFRREKL